MYNDNCYPADDFVIKWDDPTLGIDRGVSNPELSARDQVRRARESHG